MQTQWKHVWEGVGHSRVLDWALQVPLRWSSEERSEWRLSSQHEDTQELLATGLDLLWLLPSLLDTKTHKYYCLRPVVAPSLIDFFSASLFLCSFSLRINSPTPLSMIFEMIFLPAISDSWCLLLELWFNLYIFLYVFEVNLAAWKI